MSTLLLAACSDGCGNRAVAALEAPDRGHRAILFERSCGATTPFSTQISVLRKGEALSGSGNVFVGDADQGLAARGTWGGPWASMAWASPVELVITYAEGTRVFRHQDRIDGVRVTYRQGRAPPVKAPGHN